MDYTPSGDECVRSHFHKEIFSEGKKSCVHDTRVIAHLSVFLRCAVSVCPQPPFISQYNDTAIAERYRAKPLATKSLCITMGFCFTKRNKFRFSLWLLQVGERL
jgi:hypothetical protein